MAKSLLEKTAKLFFKEKKKSMSLKKREEVGKSLEGKKKNTHVSPHPNTTTIMLVFYIFLFYFLFSPMDFSITVVLFKENSNTRHSFLYSVLYLI